MDGVNNGRKGYYVTWKDAQGQMQRVRRFPPPKLHDLNSGDEATLERRLGDDFPVGTDVTIEPGNTRNPNVLKLRNDDGQTKFVPYFDLVGKLRKFREIDGERVMVNGADSAGDEDVYIDSTYLEWP